MSRKKTRTKVCISLLNSNLERLRKLAELEFNTLSGKVNAIVQNALNQMEKEAEEKCL